MRGIITITEGHGLRYLLSQLNRNDIRTVRVAIDDGVKVKVNEGMWTPPLGQNLEPAPGASGYTLHFGLINRNAGGYTAPSIITERVLEDLEASGFACHLDSFVEWGESVSQASPGDVNYGAPIHVTWKTPHGDMDRDAVLEVARMLDHIVPYLSPVDYAVMTDHDVWSVDTRVIGFYA